MSTVPATAQSSIPSQYTQTAAKAVSTQQAQQDRFLKLLVTQMKNQDPLNPMDNAQVTTQLAQISTVNGIDKLNATLKSITDSFASSQTLQASGLIGKGVLSEGNSLLLEQGRATGGVVLDDAVSGLKVKVKTKDGVEVDTVDLGPHAAGMLTFQWDGKKNDGTSAADGEYSFEVAAANGGKSVTATPIGFARVQSVTISDGQLTLDTSGLGPLRLDQIKQILP